MLLNYHKNLKPKIRLPGKVEWLFPFGDEEVMQIMQVFLDKYYGDRNPRTLLLGINPGRFGAGITGVPFTDPIRLETELGIENVFNKRQELSSVFVYDVIRAMHGPASFYSKFYISSICPLGFIKDGKNFNYYDDPKLEKSVRSYMVDHIKKLIKYGGNTQSVFSMGQGKNYKYLKALNDEHRLFDKVIPLPHPRWVMPYRLKQKNEFVKKYVDALDL